METEVAESGVAETPDSEKKEEEKEPLVATAEEVKAAEALTLDDAEPIIAEGALSNTERLKEVKSKQLDERVFYENIILSRSTIDTSVLERPLSLAIANKDKMSVSLLLEEKTQLTEIENCGFSPIHIAILSGDSKILEELLSFHRMQLESEFMEALTTITAEREKCLLEIASNPLAREVDIDVVDRWFDEATVNLHRKLELDCEQFWLRLMLVKDNEGRIPLHYAVCRGLDVVQLNLLLTCGRGILDDQSPPRSGNSSSIRKANGKSNACSQDVTGGKYLRELDDMRSILKHTKHRKLRKKYALFRPQELYSTVSGEAIVNNRRHYDLDEKKSKQGLDREPYRTRLQKISVLKSGSGRTDGQTEASQGYGGPVDYEIVVPWVLRNAVRRSQEIVRFQGDKHASLISSPVAAFCHMLKLSDEMHCGILVVPEVQRLFARIGIVVTLDIVAEICRRYSCDPERALDKLAAIKERISRRADAKIQSSRRSFKNNDDEKYESKVKIDHSHYEDSDSDSKSNVRFQALAEGKGNHEKFQDGKDSKSHVSLIQDHYESIDLLCDKEYDSVALDIKKLQQDLASGRALQSLDLSENYLTLSGVTPEAAERISHENRKYLVENCVDLPSAVSLDEIVCAREGVINACDYFGRTPLMLACMLGNHEVVNYLLMAGADVSIMANNGHNAISLAASAEVKSTIQRAFIDWLNTHKTTHGLHDKSSLRKTKSISEMSDHLTVARLSNELPKLKEMRWSYSRPALSWTVTSRMSGAVQELLQIGTSPNVTDVNGRTPLHECMALVDTVFAEGDISSIVDVAEALLNGGANTNLQSVSGRTPAHELFCKSQDDTQWSHYRLSGTNASVSNSTNNPWKQKLRYCLVQSLIKWNADFSILDRKGFAAIHYMVRDNHSDCLLSVLERRPHLENLVTSQNQNLLHLACQHGSVECCQLLTRWDVDYPIQTRLLDKEDMFGKLPPELKKPNVSFADLENTWELCRRGDATRVGDILMTMKLKGSVLWESEEAEILGQHKDRKLSLISRSHLPEWMTDDLDAKSRRRKWTCVHACVIGWAEHSCGIRLRSEDLLGKKQAKINRPIKLKSSTRSLPKKADGTNICAVRALRRDRSRRLESEVAATCSLGDGCKRHRSLHQPFLYLETLNLLLDSFAFVDSIDGAARTPLMVAAAVNWPEACNLLLSRGADVMATDLEGNTACHLAYAYGAAQCCSILEGAESYKEIQNSCGQFPLDCAGQFEKFSVIAFV